MDTFLLIMFTGFVGSFHCAAMCGPFVSYYSLTPGATWKAHPAYQLGRLGAYLGLGAAAGLLGHGILKAASVLALQKTMMIVMGVLLVAAGLSYYLPKRFLPHASSRLRRILKAPMTFTRSASGNERAALIGLFSTLLPCGFLYAYALAALASGHPLKGLLTMGAFWLGTLPATLGVGALAKTFADRMPIQLAKLTPIMLVILGLLAITGKWTALPGGESFCFD